MRPEGGLSGGRRSVYCVPARCWAPETLPGAGQPRLPGLKALRSGLVETEELKS